MRWNKKSLGLLGYRNLLQCFLLKLFKVTNNRGPLMSCWVHVYLLILAPVVDCCLIVELEYVGVMICIMFQQWNMWEYLSLWETAASERKVISWNMQRNLCPTIHLNVGKENVCYPFLCTILVILFVPAMALKILKTAQIKSSFEVNVKFPFLYYPASTSESQFLW